MFFCFFFPKWDSYITAANYIQEELYWNKHVPGLSPDEVTQVNTEIQTEVDLVSADTYLPVFLLFALLALLTKGLIFHCF